MYSDKFHVMHIITGLGVGGAERMVVNLHLTYVNKGGKSIIVALNGGKKEILDHYVNLKSDVIFLDVTVKKPLSIFLAFIKLNKLCTRYNINVIHAHMFHSLCFALVAKLLNSKRKIIFTSHSFFGFTGVRKHIIGLSKGCRQFDVVFSKNQHNNINCKDARLINNGVQRDFVDFSKRSKEKFIFIAVGRLELPKNPIKLLEEFDLMGDLQCELWFVGDGHLYDQLKGDISRRGLGDKVKLLGVRKDIKDLMRQSHCFVMPSLWEGLPVAMLEAGSIGLPVIASPVGAIPEVLADDHGYLCDPNDFHKIMRHVFFNYKEAAFRGELLAERVNSGYSIDDSVENHYKLYLTANNSK